MASVQERESAFHDTWASSAKTEEVTVRQAFEAPTALENRFILERLESLPGGLRGKRLLDIGCGLGESSVYFALRGARVTATDNSPGMIERTLDVATYHGTELETAVASADRLPFTDDSFDVVYVANTVHHLPDADGFFDEVRRVLRPGGWFFSWDPLAYNPVINVYRRIASRVRTEDEEPLTFALVRRQRRRFPNLRHRCFWIATLALFLKYYLVDRVDPNRERYWKKILVETDRSLRWWKPLLLLDGILTRLPFVKALAWNVVLWGQKPEDAGGATGSRSRRRPAPGERER